MRGDRRQQIAVAHGPPALPREPGPRRALDRHEDQPLGRRRLSPRAPGILGRRPEPRRHRHLQPVAKPCRQRLQLGIARPLGRVRRRAHRRRGALDPADRGDRVAEHVAGRAQDIEDLPGKLDAAGVDLPGPVHRQPHHDLGLGDAHVLQRHGPDRLREGRFGAPQPA